MGFGILFIGYFLTLNIELRGINIPPDFLGYALMIFACLKLADYSRNFKISAILLGVLAALSAGMTFGEIYNYFKPEEQLTFIGILSYIKMPLVMAMTYFLLMALHDISKDVGRTKIAKKTVRNIYISEVIYGLTLLFSLPLIQFEGKSDLYYLISTIAVNLVVVLNMVQIFSCYMWICYEGDEDMDPENGHDPLAKIVMNIKKENREYKDQKRLYKKGRKK